MREDPFGNLRDWGPVLELLDSLAAQCQLADCQSGLIRILRYQGNWRLREEALKRVGEIQTPCEDLIYQVLRILADDNLYYDARILASEALVQLFKCADGGFSDEVSREIGRVAGKIASTPQPPFFNKAVMRLYHEVNGSVDARAVAPSL